MVAGAPKKDSNLLDSHKLVRSRNTMLLTGIINVLQWIGSNTNGMMLTVTSYTGEWKLISL